MRSSTKPTSTGRTAVYDPMRGNEMPTSGGGTPYAAARFTIPMRGNEMIHKAWAGTSAMVYDPHEGNEDEDEMRRQLDGDPSLRSP